MAKDALGHGSNGRGGLSSAGHFMYRAQIGSGVPHNLALERVGFAFPSDYAAADALKGGGPKSDAVPVHDSMATSPVSINGVNAMMDKARAGALASVNAWGQSPKDAKIARKQIRDAKRQNRMR